MVSARARASLTRLGLGPGVRQHRVGLVLGLGGQPVGHLLREAEHLRRLHVVVATVTGVGAHGTGQLRGGRTRRRHARRRGLLALHGLRLARHGLRAGLLEVRLGVPETLLELRDLVTQVVVLPDQAGQFGLHQVEEGVDLVLVVSPLTDRGFAERDVVHVGGRQRHRSLTSCGPRRQTG
jgi:hypothetical protein